MEERGVEKAKPLLFFLFFVYKNTTVHFTLWYGIKLTQLGFAGDIGALCSAVSILGEKKEQLQSDVNEESRPAAFHFLDNGNRCNITVHVRKVVALSN